MTARSRCLGPRSVKSSWPSASSCRKATVPAYFPDPAMTGSAPRKDGVRTIWSPTKTQLTLTWWPSSCQPHGPPFSGSPYTENQYSHSLRPSSLSLNSPMVRLRCIRSTIWP